MSLNDMVQSLLVCSNTSVQQTLIDDIIEKINIEINNCDDTTQLSTYQSILHLLQSKFHINVTDNIEKTNSKLKSTFSEMHIENLDNLIQCINKLPFWIDKNYLITKCDQIKKELFLNSEDKMSCEIDEEKITKTDNETTFIEQFNKPVIIKPVVYDRELVEEVTEDMFQTLSAHLQFLKNLPQPEQRSPEWYEYRNNMLTASDLFKGLTSRDKTRYQLIAGKCGVQRNISGSASCLHGIRYEDVAIAIYEKRNDCKVEDYGCIQHPTIKIFGASPDGIVSDSNKQMVGRMLEIKCPYSRPINGIPKKEYFTQIQGQLEVCDLEYCDFLECNIKEYTNYNELLLDVEDTDEKEWGVIIQIYDKNLGKNKDIICELIDATKEDIDIWIDQTIDKILENDNLEYIKTIWWKLRLYSCVLVKRDKELFKSFIPGINKFWEDVEYYRKKGIPDEVKSKSDKSFKVDDDDDINFI